MTGQETTKVGVWQNCRIRFSNAIQCLMGQPTEVRHVDSNIIAKLENGTNPISVQTFPTLDDLTYEKDKMAVADLASWVFEDYEKQFLKRLSMAHEDVESHMRTFFDSIQLACGVTGDARARYVADALKELEASSPKKILAEFQRQALVAGWAYVSTYNAVIDKLAETFPRCRAGIFESRLKYADVLQISAEIGETLRSCSTLLDDLQRRYEILEGLQNTIQADIETPESDMIMSAMKETFKDNGQYGQDAKSMIGKLIKKTTSIVLQPLTAAGDLMSLPSLQIQGQMQRTKRMLVFLETAKMLSEGWSAWSRASREIITPNLKVMFALKRDFFRNKTICLCDMVTFNGYKMNKIASQLHDTMQKRLAAPSI